MHLGGLPADAFSNAEEQEKVGIRRIRRGRSHEMVLMTNKQFQDQNDGTANEPEQLHNAGK